MLKMVIEFDSEKIKKDGIVTEKMLFDQINRTVVKSKLIKISDGIYTDSGNKDDLTKFFAIISYLSKTIWFPRYVTKWDWYHTRYGTICDVEPEDLIEILSY